MNKLDLEVLPEELRNTAISLECRFRHWELMSFRDSWEPDYEFNSETLRLQLMIRELVRRLRLIEDQQVTLSALRSQTTQAGLCFKAGLNALWHTCYFAQRLIAIALRHRVF